MRTNDVELFVRVNGKRVSEYYHNGEIFIEGRSGSEYEIEVVNHSRRRIEAIISVDGLSVIDGKEAGNHSSGYLVEAHGSLIVPGWKVNSGSAAKFAFSEKSKSYAGHNSGHTLNTGVIGIMAYSEKKIRKPVEYSTTFSGTPVMRSSWSSSGDYSRGMMSTGNNLGITASSAVYSSDTTNDIATQSLGTEFGQKTDFKTTKTEFVRDDLAAMMVMYYDDSKGLKQRGIVLSRPSRQHLNTKPSAFPADEGCVPPPGWN